MITLVRVFPAALNLNGDQANIAVLKDFLQRCGKDVEVIDVENAKQLAGVKPSLVFFGHGSEAAHSSINEPLLSMRATLQSVDCPIFAVGSAVEFILQDLRFGSEQIRRGSRESKFDVGEFQDFQVLGYRNTDSGLPNIWSEGNLLFCMLHGPVLAKNPRLLSWLANQIEPAVPLASESEWFEKLNEVSRRIWELETEVKFEGFF